MSFLGKLMFWKKDDLGLGKDVGGFGSDNLGMPQGSDNLGMPNQGADLGGSDNLGLPSSGMPDLTTFRGVGDRQSQQQMNQSIKQHLGPDYMNSPNTGFSSFSPKQSYQEVPHGSHELEVISAKLDAIKATMDAINQRIANLERVAYGEQEQKRRW